MDTKLTPEDMSNVFRFFRIPTPLYNEWHKYAKKKHSSSSYVLADLLHSVRDLLHPSYEDYRVYRYRHRLGFKTT